MNTSKNSVQLFNFKSNEIRVVTIEGNPWFVAADVCKVLGLSNTTIALLRLDSTEKAKFSLGLPGSAPSIVSESGLYKLILRSDKKAAKPFQDWVTKTVLPAIRKDGAYVMGEEKVVTGEMSEDEFLMKAFGILQRKVERLTAENKTLTIENEEMREELTFLTVDEYRGLKHRYLTPGESKRIGIYAKRYSVEHSIPVTKQHRQYRTKNGEVIEVTPNVYHKVALDFAWAFCEMDSTLI